MILNKLIKREDDVVDLILSSLKNNNKILLTYLNQHCFNIYSNNVKYREHIDSKFHVYTDGIGIYLTLKLFKFKNAMRFDGTDLIEEIFNIYSTSAKSLYILGGAFKKEFVAKICNQKGLKLKGYHSGYINDELNKLVDDIKNVSPDVLIIGMGVPKQEIIAVKIADNIDLKIIHCVGGFLEFYFGTKKRAPNVIRNFGFEWLHRLINEPGRLWKRYILGIPLFLFQIIKLKLSTRKNKL